MTELEFTFDSGEDFWSTQECLSCVEELALEEARDAEKDSNFTAVQRAVCAGLIYNTIINEIGWLPAKLQQRICDTTTREHELAASVVCGQMMAKLAVLDI